MVLDNDQIKFLALDLLKGQSERDRQTLIGPSSIGDPCDFCVGSKLLGGGQRPNPYWMGAKIGTAIHRELEHEADKHIHTPREPQFNDLRGASIEQRVFIGEIAGYGQVWGKADLLLTTGNLIDWKTTTKTKMQRYKLDGVPTQYIYQQQLYAWGLNKTDYGPVEQCSLVFINRDGSGDSDIFVHSFPYSEELALQAWNRLEGIWEYLQRNELDSLESHPDCYTCTRILMRV